jgi:two-component system, OmpR family, phosphate regulon sensor histidine kinase PhoR
MTAEKILVVEAAPETCEFIVQHVLLPQGYTPQTAQSSTAAMEVIRRSPPSLIVAPAQAPNISGLALANFLRQEGLAIPLILLVNEWQPGLMREALRAGVADCLIHPLEAPALVEAISGALEQVRLMRWRELRATQANSTEAAQEERLQEVERLTRLAREMTAILDVDQMLAAVLDLGINLSDAEEGAILLQEGRGQALWTRAAKHYDDAFVQICRTASADQLALEVFTTAQAVRMERAAEGEGTSTHTLVQSYLYVPLQSRARLLGVMWVANRQPGRTLTVYHQRFLQALADYVAIALENASLYARTEVERAQFETILKEMVDGVVAVDTSQRLLLLNPPARAALQVKTPEVAGLPLTEVIDNAEMRAFLKGESQRGEFKLEDGRVFNAHGTSIADVGRVVVMQDITTLKELDRIKSDFVNTVSHDLRSPLTAILGYVELIGRVGPVTEQQAEFIRRIVFSVQSITTLISDLLDLGRIEAGFDTQKEATHLGTVIKFAVEDAQGQADIKRQSLKSAIAPGLPSVLANPPRLRQMLANLIGNAIKYTPAGGAIKVSATADGETVVISVADTGLGIPPSDLPYIFNKFYRASNIRDRHDGTGLGLSIVKSIVENHGGRIWVDSRPEEGTTFTVILPRSREQPQAADLAAKD